jgi:DNA-binding CsgD family transcriptional regulator
MSDLEQELLELGGDITESLEDLPLPATLLDRNGTIRWQNKASIAFRGRRVGGSFADLVAPGEEPQARDLITRILCRGEPAEMTLHVLAGQERYIPVEISAVPVREGGTVVAVFGLGRVTKTRRRPAPSRLANDLSPRQLEILRLLADGRSTDEIAAQLTLSRTTVRNHIANLIAALGVHSRLQAVAAASKAGLLDD